MNKFLFLPVLAALALSACVPTQAEYTARKESNLWIGAGKMSDKNCAMYPKEDRSQALNRDKCVSNIVREIVLPWAPFPDLVIRLIEEQTQVAHDYYDGKISQAESTAMARQVQARYRARVVSRMHGGYDNI